MALPLMFNSRTGLINNDYADSVRFHPAGGAMTGHDWQNLAEMAQQLGDGAIHLLPGSAAQVHGISHPPDVPNFLRDHPIGSAPTPLLASPLSSPARDAARALAQHTSAETDSRALLPGLLVGIDGGAGDVMAQRPALGAIWRGPGYEVIEDAAPTGNVVAIDELAALIEAAIAREASAPETDSAKTVELITPEAEHLPIGWLPDKDDPARVSLGAGLADGLLSAEIAALLGRLEVDISITPWRGLLFHDLPEGDAEVIVKVLAPRGFTFDINSPELSF
ncbi:MULTISPECIES: cobalamin biosynthesis protein [Corynebacterium]|uniref:cobalamin biosynthesis protein n=1 Tax=Corynebacterium TaxID=1716 RepID=UPI00257D7408|nr:MULTISPECIES: cobalamin biosynthesis protein [Corynebacterium]